MHKLTLTSAVLAGVLASAPAHASDELSMTRLAQTAYAIQSQYPAVQCRSYAQGTQLRPGEQRTYPTTLYRGNTYLIYAAGCAGVADLDIRLYDENWNLIMQDTATDPNPVVTVTPRWTGTFYVRMIMYRGEGHANFATCYAQ